jgi:hypothetical protein
VPQLEIENEEVLLACEDALGRLDGSIGNDDVPTRGYVPALANVTQDELRSAIRRACK